MHWIDWYDAASHWPLQWRHNEGDGISNHWHINWLLNRLFRRKSEKTSKKLRVTGLCEGNPWWPVDSPHKKPVARKMFPFDDVIIRTQGCRHGNHTCSKWWRRQWQHLGFLCPHGLGFWQTIRSTTLSPLVTLKGTVIIPWQPTLMASYEVVGAATFLLHRFLFRIKP